MELLKTFIAIIDVFYGQGRRNISEREGLKVWLCARHHNASDEGVHYNGDLDRRLKILGETVWCEKNEATPDDFIRLIGRNYLENYIDETTEE